MGTRRPTAASAASSGASRRGLRRRAAPGRAAGSWGAPSLVSVSLQGKLQGSYRVTVDTREYLLGREAYKARTTRVRALRPAAFEQARSRRRRTSRSRFHFSGPEGRNMQNAERPFPACLRRSADEAERGIWRKLFRLSLGCLAGELSAVQGRYRVSYRVATL